MPADPDASPPPGLLFLSETHPVSRRSVILEDDGTTGWLYLTAPGSTQIASDVWVFNRDPVVPDPDRDQRASPPPVPADLVHTPAGIDPDTVVWSFHWNAAGTRVTLLIDNQPIALLDCNLHHGRHRDLIRRSPWLFGGLSPHRQSQRSYRRSRGSVPSMPGFARSPRRWSQTGPGDCVERTPT